MKLRYVPFSAADSVPNSCGLLAKRFPVRPAFTAVWWA